MNNETEISGFDLFSEYFAYGFYCFWVVLVVILLCHNKYCCQILRRYRPSLFENEEDAVDDDGRPKYDHPMELGVRTLEPLKEEDEPMDHDTEELTYFEPDILEDDENEEELLPNMH